MRRCEECGKSEIQWDILDTVDRHHLRLLCVSCAARNDAVILTKPSQKALNDINSKENVYNRLRREAGLNPVKGYSYLEEKRIINPVSVSDSGNVKRHWKTNEEKNQERELERRERELAEIRKKKIEEEQRAREVEDLEKEGKINFKSKFLNVLDLKKIREKKLAEKAKKDKELIEKEKAINEVFGDSLSKEELINNHNEF